MTLDDTTSSNEITFIERASPINLATSMGAQKGRTAVGVRGNTNNVFSSLYYTGVRDPIPAGGLAGRTSKLVARVAYRFEPDTDANITYWRVRHQGVRVHSAFRHPGLLPGSLQVSSL